MFLRALFLGLVFSIMNAAITHAALSLLLQYPKPEVDEIEIFEPGTTHSILSAGHHNPLLGGSLEIKIRLFPILSSPYRDPFPVVRNPFVFEVRNEKFLKIKRLEDQSFLDRGQTVVFDFLNETFAVDGNVFPLEDLALIPVDSSVLSRVLWDKGEKNIEKDSVEMSLDLRGGFFVTKTDFIPIHPRIKKVLDKKMPRPPEKNREPRSLWSVLNVLPLNYYLNSVLPSEISAKWHPEVLRTQAIAARTYALYEIAHSRDKLKRNWDVDPTTWYQSYRGVNYRQGANWLKIESANTNEAVKLSRHKIVTYKGEVIKAYFSANSGGVTCSAKECFDLVGENPPYLLAVPDSEGIQKLPYGTWGQFANVNRATIKQRLVNLGFPSMIEVADMESGLIGETGRVWTLNVNLMNGETIKLNRPQSRSMLSLFGSIRSYMFKLYPPDQNGQQKVVGHGYGHGVGMSQYGALLFAEAGMTAEEILNYYYTGTGIVQIANDDEI